MRQNFINDDSGQDFPKFKNDGGLAEVRIGATEFKCVGEAPPRDHPHVYLNLGDDSALICPYCATRFRFDGRLAPREATPRECILTEEDEDQSPSRAAAVDGP